MTECWRAELRRHNVRVMLVNPSEVQTRFFTKIGNTQEVSSKKLRAEEIATALGGAVCGSRPVIDQGWLPLSRQVGKSGATVKPKFYLAAGISGAPEHVEGMTNSDVIIAINTDPDAPIFSVAHYGMVADCLDVLPALVETVAAKRG